MDQPTVGGVHIFLSIFCKFVNWSLCKCSFKNQTGILGTKLCRWMI